MQQVHSTYRQSLGQDQGALVSPVDGDAGALFRVGGLERGSASVPEGQPRVCDCPSGTDALGEDAPPTTNRGVRDTWGETEGFTWDTLAFTVPVGEGDSVEGVVDLVADVLGGMVALEYGFNGYSHSGIVCERGRMGWAPDRPEMGVHVYLGAQALGWLVASDPAIAGDLRGFMWFLQHDLGARFSRCDPAVDVKGGRLSVRQVARAVRKGWYTSRWRSWRIIESQGDGLTVHFGAGSSDTQLRIYDKRAERISKGCEDPGPWVRIEPQFRGQRADALVAGWLESGSEWLLSILRGLIDFKRPSEDSNKARWAVADWWAAVWDGVKRGRLVLPRAMRTIDRVTSWLQSQVAGSLAFVMLYRGDGLDSMKELLRLGMDRLTPWHHAALVGG